MEKQRFYIGNLSDPIEIDGLREFLTSEIQPRNPGETFSVDEVQIMRDSSNNCRGFGFVTISHTDSNNNEAFWGMLTKNNKPDASNPITYNGKVLRFELAMQNWKDKLSAEKAQEAKIIEKKQKLAEAYKKLLDPAEAPADATPQVSKIRAPNNKLIDASVCCGKRKTFDDIDEDENEEEEKEEKEEGIVKSDITVEKEEKEGVVEKEEKNEKNDEIEEVEKQPPSKKVKENDKSDEDKMDVEMSAKEAWKKKKEEKKKRIEEERAKKIEEGRAAVRKTGNLLDIYADPTAKWTYTKKKKEQKNEDKEEQKNEEEKEEKEDEIENENEENEIENKEEENEKEGEKEGEINGVKVLTRKERIKKREKTKKKHLKQKEKRKQRREEREKEKMVAPPQNVPEAKKPEEASNVEPHKYSITTNVSWSELMKGSKSGGTNGSKYVTSYFGGSAASSSSFSFLENGATLDPMSKESKSINIVDTRDLDKKAQLADDPSKKNENVEPPKAKKEPTSLDELIKE